MHLFEGTKVYYIRVLIYSCDNREDVRKVNVNREEVMHRQREEVCTWCKLSFLDAAISPAKSDMSALSVSCVSELCQ